jgi:hypothetical protein
MANDPGMMSLESPRLTFHAQSLSRARCSIHFLSTSSSNRKISLILSLEKPRAFSDLIRAMMRRSSALL